MKPVLVYRSIFTAAGGCVLALAVVVPAIVLVVRSIAGEAPSAGWLPSVRQWGLLMNTAGLAGAAALVIIEADSEEEARTFMENDPFVANGLMRARLHPYRAALVR